MINGGHLISELMVTERLVASRLSADVVTAMEVDELVTLGTHARSLVPILDAISGIANLRLLPKCHSYIVHVGIANVVCRYMIKHEHIASS